MESPIESNCGNVHRLRDVGYELHNSTSLRHAALDADIEKYGALNTFRYLNLAHNFMIDRQAKEITATDLEYLRSKIKKDPVIDTKSDINCLPQVNTEEDWFVAESLLTTEKINSTHLIHPKKYIGVNSVGSSIGKTYDIRGDVRNLKIPVSPWSNLPEPDSYSI